MILALAVGGIPLIIELARHVIAGEFGADLLAGAIAVATLAWIVGGDPQRFLPVMVIATPCPLLIAIPIAIIGAISVAARSGIIIKNPGVLERVDRCRTLIFDKTGTLTYGKPVLTEIAPASGFATADAVLLEPSLAKIDQLMHIGRHMRKIALHERSRREGAELDRNDRRRAGLPAARGGGGCARIHRPGSGAECVQGSHPAGREDRL